MDATNFKEQLSQAGLTSDQAALYDTLLRKGALTARKATLEAGIPRTLGYAVLKQLEDMGLVQKIDKEKGIATFAPAHPNALQERIEMEAKKAERAAIALKATLPDLASAFNLATGKPGIRFFEGEDGLRNVLYDTLSSKETIYTYSDTETVEGYASKINAEYVRARLQHKIAKKLLLLDTPTARARLAGPQSPLTQIRIIAEQDAPPIHSAMQIYDEKISYSTFTKDRYAGTIIHDHAIYMLHRFLFEHLWKNAIAAETDQDVS